MKARSTLRWLLLAGLLGYSASAPAAESLPPKPAQYVTDDAGILSAQTRAGLNTRLAAFERETSSQVLVATFPGVPEGYVMEDFTQRTAESWGVGRKANDNGAVLFVFPQNRKTRIEVGYGLEGALPDLLAKRIIQNEILPAFKTGDYNGGVTRGVEAILLATRGEYHGTGRTVADDSQAGDDSGFVVFCLILLFVVVIIVIQNRRGLKNGTFYDPSGRRDVWVPPFDGGSGSSSGGGFGSDGGFVDGGFSGGGGDFGGGGASGDW